MIGNAGESTCVTARETTRPLAGKYPRIRQGRLSTGLTGAMHADHRRGLVGEPRREQRAANHQIVAPELNVFRLDGVSLPSEACREQENSTQNQDGHRPKQHDIQLLLNMRGIL
jgi:hypothetical protein